MTVDQGPVVEVEVEAWRSSRHDRVLDALAVEEPLQIRLAGWDVAVTMRTPGHDEDLAVGFLFSEGLIRDAQDIGTVAHCQGEPGAEGNVVNLNPTDPALADPGRWQRAFVVNSSCGLCGRSTIDRIRRSAQPLPAEGTVHAGTIQSLPGALRAMQSGFDRTGGVHAAGLFDLAGTPLLVREDVGRHNAVDKVIGNMLRAGRLPLRESVLLVSSRASFEIMQKALMAGIPVVAAVSAASSLAVDLARESGMTLVGFLRDDRFNVYTGAGRILC